MANNCGGTFGCGPNQSCRLYAPAEIKISDDGTLRIDRVAPVARADGEKVKLEQANTRTTRTTAATNP